MVTGRLPYVKNIVEIIGKGAVEKLVVCQAVNQQPVPARQTKAFQFLL